MLRKSLKDLISGLVIIASTAHMALGNGLNLDDSTNKFRAGFERISYERSANEHDSMFSGKLPTDFNLSLETHSHNKFSQSLAHEINSYLKRWPKRDHIPEQAVISDYINNRLYMTPRSLESLDECTGKIFAEQGSNALLVLFPGLETLGFRLSKNIDDINNKITFKHEERAYFSFGGRMRLGSDDFLSLRSAFITSRASKDYFFSAEYFPFSSDGEWNVGLGFKMRNQMLRADYFSRNNDSGFMIRAIIKF